MRSVPFPEINVICHH